MVLSPDNTKHWPNVVWMLAHGLQRWPNIKKTMDVFFVFAGKRLCLKWIGMNGVLGHLCAHIGQTRPYQGNIMWGLWNKWDDTALQTQDSKFGPLRSKAEHAISRSDRLPIILIFPSERRRNTFASLKLECQRGGTISNFPSRQL